MGAQEVTGKIFNSRTLPKLPDVTSTNTSPFTRPTLTHLYPPSNSNFTSNSAPLNPQDGSLELPKVKREPSPEPATLNRSQQLALAPLRTNGNSPSLLGLASVCSSRLPLPSADTDRTSSVKTRPYSPPPSPYPKRRTSTSSGDTMEHSYQSPRLGNRDSYDRRGLYTSSSRDSTGSNASTSAISSTNSNVRPMMVDSPGPGVGSNSAPHGSRPVAPGAAPTDRLWANYRSRGGSFAAPPRDGPPPVLSSHSTLPNLGIPSPYGNKRPSPSNAGESEKDDMEEDSEGGTMRMGGLGKDDDSFTSHREKRRVIEKKSRMRRVDALDHLRLVVSREYQYRNGGSLSALHNIDPLTQAPRKNCQADICFEAVEIIEKLRSENDRLRHQNRDLMDRLSATNGGGSAHSHSHGHGHGHGHGSHVPHSVHSHGAHGGPHGSPTTGGGRTV